MWAEPTSRASLPAMAMWMPCRMSGAAMPRLTRLITSVSESTAQTLETCSGEVAFSESGPTSSSGTPR